MEDNKFKHICNAYLQQKTGEVTFKGLPANIQEIAAETLKSLIVNNNGEEEQAMESARLVRKAFIQLYESGQFVEAEE